MTDIFKIKKNDTYPPLAVTLQFADGTPINLTGAGSVWFNMGNLLTYQPYFSGLAIITGSTLGQCEYRWTGSPDVQTTGTFWAEFEVHWTGSRMTLPPDHSLKVEVYEDYN